MGHHDVTGPTGETWPRYWGAIGGAVLSLVGWASIIGGAVWLVGLAIGALHQ